MRWQDLPEVTKSKGNGVFPVSQTPVLRSELLYLGLPHPNWVSLSFWSRKYLILHGKWARLENKNVSEITWFVQKPEHSPDCFHQSEREAVEEAMSTGAEEQPLRHEGGQTARCQTARCQPARRGKAAHWKEQSMARLLPGRQVAETLLGFLWPS